MRNDHERAGSRHKRTGAAILAARTAGFVLPLLLVTSCGADAQTAEEAPTVEDMPVVTQDAALPLEPYLLSLGEQAELKDAYRELLTRCASEYGGEPVVVQPGTEKLVAESRMWGGRFGTMSLEHASSLGYHAGPDDPVAPSFGLFANDGDEPLATILYGADRQAMGEEDTTSRPAIEGLPEGGCVAKVEQVLGGDPLATVPNDIDKMRLTAFRDDRTQTAVRTWVACMSEAGFDYKSVDGPADTFGDGRPLAEEEIAVAIADVTCTKSSRWRDISFAIEKAYQERELRGNPDKWADVKSSVEAIYRNARRELAEGSR